MAAHRRSDWRGARARLLRHLGDPLARPVRLWEVWGLRAVRPGQRRPADRAVLRRWGASPGRPVYWAPDRDGGNVRGGHGRDARGEGHGAVTDFGRRRTL